VAAIQADITNGFVSPRMAQSVYGVTLRPGTVEIDPAATEKHRDELRQERLKRGKPLSEQPSPARSSLGQGSRQPLWNTLYVENGSFSCGRCGTAIAGSADNPKLGCLLIEAPLKDANPYMAMRWGGDSLRFELREYVCPGCGRLLFLDERLKAEDTHWHDIKVDAWR